MQSFHTLRTYSPVKIKGYCSDTYKNEMVGVHLSHVRHVLLLYYTSFRAIFTVQLTNASLILVKDRQVLSFFQTDEAYMNPVE